VSVLGVVVAIGVSIAGVGIPALVVLPPMLAFGRATGAAYRELARSLLDVNVPESGRAPRRKSVLGFIVYYFAEPVGWRAIAHVWVKLILLGLEVAVGVGFRLFLPLAVLGLLVSGGDVDVLPVLIIGSVLFL